MGHRNVHCRSGRLCLTEAEAPGFGPGTLPLPAVQNGVRLCGADLWPLVCPVRQARLLRPDEVIEPYDIRPGTSHRTTPPIHQWAARVREQLAVELDGLGNVKPVALAGEQYRCAVHNAPGSTRFR